MSDATQAAPADSNRSARPRYDQLDSVRGIAALAVVFHHFILMVFDGIAGRRFQPFLRVTEPFWNGRAAVVVFFVLSGFVLFLPYQQLRTVRYIPFILRRTCRIYLPYLAALVVAVAGAYFLHDQIVGRTYWSRLTWVGPIDWKQFIRHIGVFGKFNAGQFNTAFWSLIIEMKASVVFPAVAILFQRLSPKVGIVVAVAITAAIQMLHIGALQFAPCFMAGILLARWMPTIVGFCATHGVATNIMRVAAICAFYVPEFRYGGPTGIAKPNSNLLDVVYTLGATVVIFLAIDDQLIRKTLQHRWLTFLGKISFSLYLFHGTVLFTMFALFDKHLSLVLIAVCYLLIAFGISILANRFIEEPCMSLGRIISRWAEDRLTQPSASSTNS